MIDRQYGLYTVACDVCGKQLDGEYDSFSDTVDGLKANGWKSINNCGMWENFCPDCVRNVIFNPGASEFAGLK